MSIDSEFSGTTGVVGVLRASELHVCNIGDSRLIIGNRVPAASAAAAAPSLVPVEVTADHKPELPEERERILAAGGRVFSVTYEDGEQGPARVWLADVDIPGLAMSRSLGDTVAHTAGVTSEPEVHHVLLRESQAYLVWASDGLWEFLTNEEVLAYLEAAEKQAAGSAAAADAADVLKSAVDKMITESSSRWVAKESVIDDITVIVVQLDVPKAK